MRRLPFAIVCLLWCEARAFSDEKEWILSATPGAAVARAAGQTAWGGGGGIDVAYGITDAVSVRATAALTGHAIDATPTTPSGALLAYYAGAGVTYAIDILRLVPYLDFSVGYLGTRRPAANGSVTNNDFGLEIGIGVDYLVNRRISVGAVVRYHASLTEITEIPLYLYIGPRLAFHFGG